MTLKMTLSYIVLQIISKEPLNLFQFFPFSPSLYGTPYYRYLSFSGTTPISVLLTRPNQKHKLCVAMQNFFTRICIYSICMHTIQSHITTTTHIHITQFICRYRYGTSILIDINLYYRFSYITLTKHAVIRYNLCAAYIKISISFNCLL